MLHLLVGVSLLALTAGLTILLRQLESLITAIDLNSIPVRDLPELETKLVHLVLPSLLKRIAEDKVLSNEIVALVKDGYNSRLAAIEVSKCYARTHASALLTLRRAMTFAAVSLAPIGAVLVFAPAPEWTLGVALVLIPVLAAFVSLCIYALLVLSKAKEQYTGTVSSLQTRLSEKALSKLVGGDE